VGIFVTIAVSAYFLIRQKGTYFIAAASTIIGSVLLYLFNNIIRERINQIFNDLSLFVTGVTSTSIGARLLMWKAALEMLISNPLFGVGPGDYKSSISAFVSAGRFPESILRYNQPHNMYLFALATTGLIGFFALVFIFYKALRHTKRLLCDKNRFFGALALAVSLHFMTAGLTESLFNIHVLTCSFALISGICIRKSGIKS
jgi:O-antigen ligase